MRWKIVYALALATLVAFLFATHAPRRPHARTAASPVRVSKM